MKVELLQEELVAFSQELGFDALGFAPVPSSFQEERLSHWLALGHHASMDWMERGYEKRIHPQSVLPEAKSILVLGYNYYQKPPLRRGQIASYALGKDYHKIIYKKLKRVCTFLRERGALYNKPYVDTGPIMEKPLAALAGLGWQGKHSNLIHPNLGNYIFLGIVFTSIEFPSNPVSKERCGRCQRCLDICPTGAIVAPYQLDSSRCISYLTIEHKDDIPLEMRPLIGDHLYGCDDCIRVCPWNRWAKETKESRFMARDYPDLRDMLYWDELDFSKAFEGSAIRRIKLSRWLRNVCVVLGNIGDVEDLSALEFALKSQPVLVQTHAKWAIEQIERCSC